LGASIIDPMRGGCLIESGRVAKGRSSLNATRKQSPTKGLELARSRPRASVAKTWAMCPDADPNPEARGQIVMGGRVNSRWLQARDLDLFFRLFVRNGLVFGIGGFEPPI
jgi:hypothetical protein